MGVKVTLIPLAFFAFNLISSFFSMPVGILSNRIGRRPVLIMGLFIFAAIYFGFGVWIWVLFALYGLYYALVQLLHLVQVALLLFCGIINHLVKSLVNAFRMIAGRIKL